VSRRLGRTLVIALLALPGVALADGPGAGAPAPPKNAPVDKPRPDAPSQDPTKPEQKAPAKNKPVDKPAGTGSGAGSGAKPLPPLQKKSPARHA